MELMATGRKARSRYFSLEEMQKGFGILITDAQDFPRAERDRLTAEIVAAFQAGALTEETLDPARRIANALRSSSSALEALRTHLQADGRELGARGGVIMTLPSSGGHHDPGTLDPDRMDRPGRLSRSDR